MGRGTGVCVQVVADLQAAIAGECEAKYPYRSAGNEAWSAAPNVVLAWRTDDLEKFVSTPIKLDFGGPA